MVPTSDKSTNAILGGAAFHTSERVGRVLFNPPSRMERRVKENPPYAAALVGHRLLPVLYYNQAYSKSGRMSQRCQTRTKSRIDLRLLTLTVCANTRAIRSVREAWTKP
jgi:hypothetical protein